MGAAFTVFLKSRLYRTAVNGSLRVKVFSYPLVFTV